MNKSIFKFLAVGVCNTLLTAAIMFLLYEFAGLGYWGSSALSYLAGAVLSFFLNRRFTFQSKAPLLPTALKFAVTVGVCYVVAYSLAQPLVEAILPDFAWREQFSMLVGMGLYTCLNYVGQRFFAFRSKEN